MTGFTVVCESITLCESILACKKTRINRWLGALIKKKITINLFKALLI